MSDTPIGGAPQSAPAPAAEGSDARIMAIVCYVLYIAVFTNGLTGIVGVVLAYVKRGEARGTIWESHFINLIHVFWTGIIAIAIFLGLAGLGAWGVFSTAQTNQFTPMILVLPVIWLGFVGYFVWYLYRTVKGLVRAIDSKPYS
ncbi:MAG TPA: hypothetical protein VIJ85_13485 [Rhizomicrobium sp.]